MECRSIHKRKIHGICERNFTKLHIQIYDIDWDIRHSVNRNKTSFSCHGMMMDIDFGRCRGPTTIARSHWNTFSSFEMPMIFNEQVNLM